MPKPRPLRAACSSSMTETSVALCAALLAAKAWGFLQQHRSMREALATAKRSVQQQLGADGAEAGARHGAGGPPALQKVHKTVEHKTVQHTIVQQQYRTPTVPGGTAGERASAAEVSPLIQRGTLPRAALGPAPEAERATLATSLVACIQRQRHRHGSGVLIPRFWLLACAAAGLILNEETGHIIGIGKATYNRLGAPHLQRFRLREGLARRYMLPLLLSLCWMLAVVGTQFGCCRPQPCVGQVGCFSPFLLMMQ